MLKVTSKVSFKNLEKLLKRKKTDPRVILRRYGEAGVDALARATPVDTGLTALSWYYSITRERDRWILTWHNSNIQNGIPIALLIQLGHGTKSGGYVQGIDYINPAIRGVFEDFAKNIGKELFD